MSKEIAGLCRVPLQALRFHPRNIRSHLGDLTELTESIRREGVLVPLMAHRTPGGGLQLLHGHRRWAAADLARLRTVPVVIVDGTLTDDEAILLMLAEDKKEAVDVADRAAALRTLQYEFSYSASTLAERLGVDEETFAAWQRGDRTRRTTATRIRRQPRRGPVAPRVKPTQLHAVISDWDGRAPTALLGQLRGLLGGWSPAATSDASTKSCAAGRGQEPKG